MLHLPFPEAVSISSPINQEIAIPISPDRSAPITERIKKDMVVPMELRFQFHI